MIADHRYQSLKYIHYYAEIAAYPISYVANLPTLLWNKIYYNYAAKDKLSQENKLLRQQNIQMATQINQFQGILQENKRLRQLLQSSYGYENEHKLVAEFIIKSSTPFKQRILLNKGTRNSVYVGQPILGASGILGQIISVTPFSATGMLISDPAHQMLAQVARSQVYVLVSGTGNPNQLELNNQPLTTSIRIGDTLVTTGLDDVYPSNFPIGSVTEIIKSATGDAAKIIIKPLAKLTQGREVLLVWNKSLKK